MQAAGGSGWSAGLGSNLGWALSSFGGAKAKGQTFLSLLHWLGNPVTGMLQSSFQIAVAVVVYPPCCRGLRQLHVLFTAHSRPELQSCTSISVMNSWNLSVSDMQQ